MYYKILKSLDEVIGEDKFLRLPEYIDRIFVVDESREKAIKKSLDILSKGGSVIILGKAGSGKTSTLAIILKHLVELGYKVAILNYNATLIDNTHMDDGAILFYDDISTLPSDTIKALFTMGVKGFIATLREEEKERIEKIVGAKIESSFSVIFLEDMSKDNIKEVMRRIANAEGITIETPEVFEIVAEKARNLPVYVWQLIRDLKINKKTILTVDFAQKVPEGMLDYIDNIIWRVLDEHEERREILLTLIMLSDMPNYEMHQQLFNATYVVAKEELYNKKFDLKVALLSDLLDRISRYLTKSSKYSLRLPHDSWKDVLQGKSKGLMSGDISRLRVIYDYEQRRLMLKKAAKLALDIVQRERDPESIYELIDQLRRAGISPEEKPEIEASETAQATPTIAREIQSQVPIQKEEIVAKEMIREAPPVERRVEKIYHKVYAFGKSNETIRKDTLKKLGFDTRRITDITISISKTLSVLSGNKISSTDMLRSSKKIKLHRRSYRVIYPELSGLRVEESAYYIDAVEDSGWILWILWLVIFFVSSAIFAFIPGFNFMIGLIIAFWGIDKIHDMMKIYFEEIELSGSPEVIQEFLKVLRKILGRDPTVPPNSILMQYIKNKFGVTDDAIRRSWKVPVASAIPIKLS